MVGIGGGVGMVEGADDVPATGPAMCARTQRPLTVSEPKKTSRWCEWPESPEHLFDGSHALPGVARTHPRCGWHPSDAHCVGDAQRSGGRVECRLGEV